MSDLIEKSNEAVTWVNEIRAAYSGKSVFGKVESSVIWSDAKGPDGELLVPIDPVTLVENINTTDYPLLNGHDPGFPLGCQRRNKNPPAGRRKTRPVCGVVELALPL